MLRARRSRAPTARNLKYITHVTRKNLFSLVRQNPVHGNPSPGSKQLPDARIVRYSSPSVGITSPPLSLPLAFLGVVFPPDGDWFPVVFIHGFFVLQLLFRSHQAVFPHRASWAPDGDVRLYYFLLDVQHFPLYPGHICIMLFRRVGLGAHGP